ncbi:MAG: calcium-binding protein [Hyphomicrobium sp.]|nr:calcium-binding protein [Hyphomicrobium sp.]
MAFKALGVGTDGDIYSDPAYSYGVFDDTILVLANSGSHTDLQAIITGEGRDTVYTVRPNAGSIQHAFLGFGADTYYGGAAVDVVSDGSGNDFSSLGDGNDVYRASAGNDTVDGGAGTSDFVTFERLNSDDGSNTNNNTGVLFDLAKTTQSLGQFGTDTLTGFEGARGSWGNDTLLGSAGANSFLGGFGNDRLEGRGGVDTLAGEDGNDTLIGGAGADQINFSNFAAERDVAKYLGIGDSGIAPGTFDVILNFDQGGTATDDKIDLSSLDANKNIAGDQAFTFVGANPFSLPGGEVRVVVSGPSTLVYIDNDGDATVEMVIQVSSVTGLQAFDFIL